MQVHSLRMPSFVLSCERSFLRAFFPASVLSCETVFGADDDRLVIRHDDGSPAAPCVAGTLLAARRVFSFIGLKRGLDAVMD
ncbi:hypothetical protein [Microvirga sp. M2]|uniref:hypothetical protein n=1 Tax=Microvirga sp. M2 TaxID=3073270 RepID=UPI0039C45763